MSAKLPATAPNARKAGSPLASPKHQSQCSKSLWAVALRIPLTFSITTNLGFKTSIALANSSHRPERVPSFNPARLPARERSWHGNPPVKTSTGGTVAQSTFDTSLKLGTLGRCFAKIADGASSHSQCQITSPPVTASTARSRPP